MWENTLFNFAGAGNKRKTIHLKQDFTVQCQLYALFPLFSHFYTIQEYNVMTRADRSMMGISTWQTESEAQT
jgi:hypothetical protein